jgi:hypothetical protein
MYGDGGREIRRVNPKISRSSASETGDYRLHWPDLASMIAITG